MENTIQTTNATPTKTREKSDHNRVLQIDLTTGVVINSYASPYRASEAVDYSCKRIKMACRGERKNAGGFFWCYENPELQAQYSVTPESYKGK